MKKITTAAGTFGPYATIETLTDRYRCDGADLPFSVVGQGAIDDVVPGDFPAPVIPAPSVDEIVAAMESLFDTTAQSHRYDNRITCALRAGYSGPFQAEGLAFATWMDSCNATAYQMLAQVQTGTMSMPATLADALTLLPEMVWPA